ncbi:DUF3221 domain-containing protein [Halobacillus litoralis]|uniref:DUF3221 domain-containing protein n=1 Tax=Halobacillus litoralis TaxID=45668 RepID=UPI001CD66ADF|nr:DUF3221 domain-containing protein [Halobacillus litoralis]MCA0972225.1 DUF3221 domain-containing protein [Halobacillus litoralis]
MKKIISLSFFCVLVLSACGQAEQPEEKKASGSAGSLDSYQMLVESCPEPDYEGQTFSDLSEEEQKLYDVDQISDEMKEHNPMVLEVASLQGERQEFLRKSMAENGYSFDDLREIGDMYMVKGTIVLQFKKRLTEKELKVKEAFLDTANDLKQAFNENAIRIEEVEMSATELRNQHDALSQLLEGSSIRSKLWGYGTCTPSKQLNINVTEQLTEEELNYLNENTEVKIAIRVTPPNLVKGYVTDVREDEMLVDMTWFSNRPEEVQVGDYVNVSYTNVMESLPAQAGARETEILKDAQPEGADLKASEVILKAVDQAKEVVETPDHRGEYFNVKEIEYVKDGDRWDVVFETTSQEEPVKVEVKDE